MTLVELMIALGIIGFVLLACYSSSTALQRGFGYASAWTEARADQTRLLDSLGVDLRNATKIVPFPSPPASFTLPITLTIPNRYTAYRNTGFAAGDPATTAAPISAPTPGTIISRTTINIRYDDINSTIDVYYALSADRTKITRTVTRIGSVSSAGAFRNVATFPNQATVQFKALSPTSITISVTTRPDPDYLNPAPTSTTILEDSVFLREISTQPAPTPVPRP